MFALTFIFLNFGLIWHEVADVDAPSWMWGATGAALTAWVAWTVAMFPPNMVAL